MPLNALFPQENRITRVLSVGAGLPQPYKDLVTCRPSPMPNPSPSLLSRLKPLSSPFARATPPCNFARSYGCISVLDSAEEKLCDHFETAFRFIEEGVTAG